MGPRPTGSPASRALAAYIRARLPRGRYEDEPGGVRNVVGGLPGRGKAILLAAHYDTKLEPFRFVGANDGAGGTAELLELARALRHTHRPRGAPPIRFVAFDGEESPDDRNDFDATGLRGSKPYAARHAHELRAMILLDFVANRQLSIPREAGSDPALWARLRAAARRAGVARAFPDAVQGEVLDDHTPFARRGVPSIELIDFDFPCWHRACDDLSAVSRRSLADSGAAVLELLRSWR
jgi:glutaminyl-peptide cyclotransferase